MNSPAKKSPPSSTLTRRRLVQAATAAPLLGAASGVTTVGLTTSAAAATPTSNSVRDAMLRAATYMDETVSYEGAYVWSYRPDLSLTWGEMEARRTMCWVQPPGTPTV